MDLRVFYERIRQVEAAIQGDFAVVISRATPDGGKAGIRVELPRAAAARLVADAKADLASPEEAAQFRDETEKKWREARLNAADRR